MLELRALTIARGTRTLLRGIDATFAAGTFTALMGANGVGKSTLLATLCGVLAPQAGSVLFDGAGIRTFDARARAQRIALVEPAEPALSSVSVADIVNGARFAHHRWWEWQPTDDDRAAVDAALAATGLSDFRARELGTLSAGERQRTWIALALAQRARVIALDEPTTHLDLRYAIETLELLRRLADRGEIVIAVLHSLEEAAAFADRVVLLGDQRVLADAAPADALTPALLATAYGVAIDVERRGDGLAFYRKTQRPADESAGRRADREID